MYKKLCTTTINLNFSGSWRYMADVVITYENLYELLRKEKYRSELQEVPPTYLQDVVKYLQEKAAIVESQAKKQSIFASTELEKTQTQLRNVQKILKEHYEKRENKILQAALFASRANHTQDTSKMLPEEGSFFAELKGVMDKYRQGILGNVLRSKAPDLDIVVLEPSSVEIEQKPLNKEDKTNNPTIQILEDIPEFVGPDLNTYGPFTKGSVQAVPEMVAKLLVQTNQAKNENT
jgi:DNA replication initiation complex subunit (GINS family)